MKKIALLVTFVPMTRLVLEVPDGMDEQDFIDNNTDLIARAAREKMLKDAGDYLYGDNMEIRHDEEMPASPDEKADQDPENPIIPRAGFGFRNNYNRNGILVYREKDGKTTVTEILTEFTAQQVTAFDADDFVTFCSESNLI